MAGHWLRRRHFSPAVLDELAAVIQASEANHQGELVIVVESHLPRDVPDAHARALEVFGRQLVWDTPDGTGMLLYLALGDHCIEIIADRGVNVPDKTWSAVCADLQKRLCAGDYAGGLRDAIGAIEQALSVSLPASADNSSNQLADRPVLL